MNKRLIFIILIVVVVGFWLFSGSGNAEKTARQALEAMNENKVSKFVSLMCDETIEYQIDANGAKTKKVLVKQYKQVFDDFQDQMKDRFGKKWDYKIEIIDSYDCERTFTNSEALASLNDRKLQEVAYEITYTGKGMFKEKQEVENGTLLLVKKGNKWQIVDFN